MTDDKDGLAEVQALRADAETAAFEHERAIVAEHERDALAAEVARLKEQVAGLVDALDAAMYDVGYGIADLGEPARSKVRAALAQAQPAAEEKK